MAIELTHSHQMAMGGNFPSHPVHVTIPRLMLPLDHRLQTVELKQTYDRDVGAARKAVSDLETQLAKAKQEASAAER